MLIFKEVLVALIEAAENRLCKLCLRCCGTLVTPTEAVAVHRSERGAGVVYSCA